MAVETGPHVESVTDANEQLIAEAKAELERLALSRNPDQVLTDDESRRISTIVDIMLDVGSQRVRLYGDTVVTSEAPHGEHLEQAYPT
jgi:hypothetical protein